MRLHIFLYKCDICEQWFEAPEINEFAYGEFLMRSESGEMRYLNALSDDVFMEVRALLGDDPRVSSFNRSQRAEILIEIYGVACDVDLKGDLFRIGAEPCCSICHQRSIEEWKASEPPRYVDVDVIPVSYKDWKALTEQEKRMRICEALDSSSFVTRYRDDRR